METQQPSVYASLVVTLFAASLTLFLRLLCRRMTKQDLGYDDMICIAAFVFAVCWAVIVFLWLDHGLGLKIADVGPAEMVTRDSLFYLYFVELAYAFSLAFSKLAILAFYWRMFKTSGIKIPIITLIVATVVWLIIRTFLAIFHCVPVQAFWDKTIPNYVCKINDAEFFFGSVLAHLLLDLAIMALPVLQIRNLQLRTSQKLGVTAMFTFGVFVCVASIVVIVYSLGYDPKTTEPSWDVTPIIIWASVEVNLAVVSACLPLLRPVFIIFLRKMHITSSFKGTDDDGYPTGGRSRPKSFVRLHTLRKGSKETSAETESTHQLADSDTDGSFRGRSTLAGPRGPQVTITGSRNPEHSPDIERGQSPSDEFANGIMVKSETSVRVSNAM